MIEFDIIVNDNPYAQIEVEVINPEITFLIEKSSIEVFIIEEEI